MQIDLAASQPHFLAHMIPVWRALPDEHRGQLYLSRDVASRAPAHRPIEQLSQASNVVLVAGFDDLKRVGGRPAILMEHGCGQSYHGDQSAPEHPSYAGGQGRHGVAAFLHPNEISAPLDRERYPDSQVSVIGSPRLAELQKVGAPKRKGKPVVAMSFHFDCPITPESSSAWRHWAGAFEDLCKNDRYDVLAHAHPRSFRDMAPFFEQCGAEPVELFEDVLARAWVYCCDNSSTMFEWAALRGPSVVLDAPWYRPEVNHGLRFWDCADIGPRILDPDALVPAIETALDEAPWPGVEAILSRIFPAVENPAATAAEAAVATARDAYSFPPRSASQFPRAAPIPG